VFELEHDYVVYPELTNSQLADFGFSSPHIQITDDFSAFVVKVHDGDTVTLRTDFRDFDFPLRFRSVDAPELSTGEEGELSWVWLKGLIEGEFVEVKIDFNNRVEKYGRLLGDLVFGGLNVGEMSVQLGYSFPFERRREGDIPDLNKVLAEKQWF